MAEVVVRGRALTVGERSEILRLIHASSETAIKAINASDPSFPERFAERLRKRAIGLLKVDKDLVTADEIQAEIDILERKKAAIERQITAKMPKKRDGYRRNTGCAVPMPLCEAITELEDRIRAAEKVKDPIGKKLVAEENALIAKERKLAQCITREDVAKANIL